MATFTTNYNFGLPQVGGDKNAWGQFLNTNWNTLDTLLKNATDTANAALPKAGGSMTGFVSLSADPTAALHATTKQYVDAADTSLSTRVTNAQTRADSAFANAALAQTTADAKVPTTGDATKNGALTVTGTLITNSTFTAAGAITTNGGNVNFSSTSRIYGTATDIGFYNPAGTVSCKMTLASGDFTASGNVIAYSDAKLKKNVETIKDAVAIVNRMRGVFYDRIDTGVAQVGVIAQEMQEVLPQVVTSSDETLGVAYGNLTAVLIEAVKELSERVAKLEAR